MIGKNGNGKHDCKHLNVPKCIDFKKCQYEAGHKQEAKADRKIAKLKNKSEVLSKLAAEQVISHFCACCLTRVVVVCRKSWKTSTACLRTKLLLLSCKPKCGTHVCIASCLCLCVVCSHADRVFQHALCATAT